MSEPRYIVSGFFAFRMHEYDLLSALMILKQYFRTFGQPAMEMFTEKRYISKRIVFIEIKRL